MNMNDDFTFYHVGQILPKYKGVEGAIFDYTDAGAVLFCSFTGIHPAELEAVDNGKFSFKVGEYKGIIWLFWKYDGMDWQDVPFHRALAINRTEEIEPVLDGMGYTLLFFLIEGSTGELKRMRAIGLPNRASREFYRLWQAQEGIETSPAEQQAKVNNIYKQLTTAQLMKASGAK